MRLLVDQRVQLLGLWDHDGKQVTDLGDFAKPADEPTVLPLTLFETSGAAPDALDANFTDLLLKLIAIQLFPTLEPFPLRARSVTGYCSAARKTLLVRWTLRDWRDEVVAPPAAGIEV